MARVRQDNIQVKLEINGKEAVNTLADLNKRYRTANKELRNLAIGSEEFVEKQKEIAQIKNLIQQNRNEIKQYQKAIDDVSPKSILALSRSAKDLRKDIEELEPGTEAFIMKAEELETVEAELEAAKRQAGLLKDNLADLDPGSIAALTARAKELEDEMSRLNPATQEFAAKAAELGEVKDQLEAAKQEAARLADNVEDLEPKSIAALSARTKELRAELEKLNPETEEYRQKLKELGKAERDLQGVKKGFDQATKGTRGLRGGFKKLEVFLKASLIGALVGLGAYLVNIFKQTGDAIREMQGLREELNLTTGATGDELDRIAARTKATSEVYQVEIDKVKDSSFAAAQAFGTSYDEILDLTRKGLDATGKQGEEFLEQVKEYGVQFEQAGFSAEETFAIIANSIQDGRFLDKGADAVKEFGLRITNLSKTQRETLETAFGSEFTQRIAEGIETGEITTKEALTSISTELNQLGEDSVQTKRVVSEIFGAPGEDVGVDFILSLADAEKGFDGLIDTTNVYFQRRQELLELEDEAAAQQAELSRQLDMLGGELSGVGNFFKSVGLTIKSGFFNILSETIEFVRYIPERFKIFRIGVLEQINVLVSKGNALLDLLISPLRGLVELLGFDFPEIKIPPIEIDTSAAELQKQLQEQIAKDRKEFADQQKREALADRAGQAAAERQAQLQAENERRKQLQEQAAARRKEIQAAAEEERKLTEQVRKNIRELQTELIDDETEQQLRRLEVQTQEKIRALQGSEEEIRLQTVLLKRKQAEEVEQIEKKAFEQRILNRQQEATEELTQMKSSSEEFKTARARIEQELIEEIADIQEEYIQQQKTRIEQRTELEIASLTGTKEQIEEETQRIYAARDAEITRLEKSSFQAQTEQVKLQYQARRDVLKQLEESLVQDKAETAIQAEQVFTNERLRIEQERDEAIRTARSQGREEEIASLQATYQEKLDQITTLESSLQEQQASALTAEQVFTTERLRIEQERDEAIRTARSQGREEEIAQLQATYQEKLDQVTTLESSLQEQQASALTAEQVFTSERLRIEQERDEAIRTARSQGREEEIAQLQATYQEKLDQVTTLEQDVAAQQFETREEAASFIAERVKEIEATQVEELAEVKKKAFQDEALLSSSTRQQIEQNEEQTYQARLSQLEKYQQKKRLEITRQVIEEAEAGELTQDIDAELQERLKNQYESYLQEKQALNESFGKDDLTIAEEIEALKLQATKDRIDAETQAEREQEEERKRRRNELIEKTAELLGELQNLNNTVLDNQVSRLEEATSLQVEQINLQREQIERNLQAELDAAGDNAEAKEEIETRYSEILEKNEAQRTQVEKKSEAEREELQEKAQKRRKVLSIVQKAIAIRDVVVETARSIVKTGGQLGYPAAIPFQVLAGAIGATQVATIAAQKYEKGKRPGPLAPERGKGGLPQGPSHDEGGIKLYDSKTGQVVGEMEGNEAILSVKTYENNRELVDKLLFTSMYNNGARIYQDGGLLSAPTTTPSEDLVQETAALSDQRIVDRLISLEGAVRDLRLVIDEEGAVAIDRMAGQYKGRLGIRN
jgi:hypothetical protein